MKLNDRVLDRVIGGANTETARTAGINCPVCGEFIPTSIEKIVSGEPLLCRHCHWTQKFDIKRSSSAIEALRKAEEAMAELERKQQAQ